jgi:hypothetical protein
VADRRRDFNRKPFPPAMRLLPVALGLLLALPSPTLFAQTSIRPDPSGPRILFVDGDNIRPDPNGKRLLFVDGDDIRPEPGGKRLLFIDGDNVRPDPHGVRLAFWDGNTLRRTLNGQILLFVDGDTIRDKFGGKRLYFIDGPALSRQKLTAVLYHLKPELFTLSEQEIAAKKEEMRKNEAETDARAAADQFVGNWEIITHYTSGDVKRKGSVAVTPQGTFYGVEFKTGETPPWKGIAVKYKTKLNDQELWIAMAPAGAVGLGIYQVQGGNLTGTWLPVNAATDKSVLGFEKLTGSPQVSGAYTITAGKLPNGGVTYTGAMNIDPLKENMNTTARCVRFRWATGNFGIGFVLDNTVAVSAGGQTDFEILRLQLGNGSMNGDFLSAKGAKGYYTLIRQ